LEDILLITLGALLGSNLRYLVYKRLQKIDLSENSIILFINTLSSFTLGLFLSILPQSRFLGYSYQLGLFFSIGLLGSLSTFSTFIYHIYELFSSFKFYRAFKLSIISLTSGLLSFSFGFLLGS
tara:strand:+ start:216 stop:587 length:372 start_codon:yes stop_codon:yes gene_type:complete